MPQGTELFEYKLDKAFFTNMESADVRDAALTVKLTVVHKGGFYTLDFAVGGTVTLLCDRCLDDLVQPIEAGYHIIVKYGDRYNDESDDILEIPESDNYLNVAYMIYDTVMLAIPIKHVHPQGKCNRAMSSLLKKHRAQDPDDGDSDIEDELIDEIDDIDQPSTDPRWDELKKLNDNN
jgi:uncharacterized metal-binding protein YceD (DUF177 family)